MIAIIDVHPCPPTIDGSAFRVRSNTSNRVTKAIASLKLNKNENCGYAYNDARFLEKQIERELEN